MSDFKLPTDQYYIRVGETFAGRNRVEDRSLLPKRVNAPTDHDSDPELWVLEALDSGRYHLRARGALTGAINNLLFAFLVEQDKAEEWIITKQNDDGNRNQYTIEKADKSAGWVKQPDGGNPQIAVRPLSGDFLPSELWNIQPLVD